MARRQRRRDHVQQTAHLPVHHDRVQPLLAAEVLVHHRLGHPGLRRDLLHRRALEALRREQGATDLQQLLPTLRPCHPGASRAPRLRVTAGTGGTAGVGRHTVNHAASAAAFPCREPSSPLLRRESIRERDGQRTSYAHPSISNHRMKRAEESTCPRITPCRADVGSAWCRLCQDSPHDSTASHQTLPDRSAT